MRQDLVKILSNFDQNSIFQALLVKIFTNIDQNSIFQALLVKIYIISPVIRRWVVVPQYGMLPYAIELHMVKENLSDTFRAAQLETQPTFIRRRKEIAFDFTPFPLF